MPPAACSAYLVHVVSRDALHVGVYWGTTAVSSMARERGIGRTCL